jgi:hypothetical protein
MDLFRVFVQFTCVWSAHLPPRLYATVVVPYVGSQFLIGVHEATQCRGARTGFSRSEFHEEIHALVRVCVCFSPPPSPIGQAALPTGVWKPGHDAGTGNMTLARCARIAQARPCACPFCVCRVASTAWLALPGTFKPAPPPCFPAESCLHLPRPCTSHPSQPPHPRQFVKFVQDLSSSGPGEGHGSVALASKATVVYQLAIKSLDPRGSTPSGGPRGRVVAPSALPFDALPLALRQLAQEVRACEGWGSVCVAGVWGYGVEAGVSWAR